MVDIPGLRAKESCIDDVVFGQSEIVAIADSELDVIVFASICDRFSDLFADVFDYDVFGIQSVENKWSKKSSFKLTFDKQRDRSYGSY